MEKKRQTMRFSDIELSTIKNTFAETYELYQAIRKVFLQLPLDAIDKDLLAVFKHDDVFNVFSKTVLPKIDPTAPLHQLIDLWMTVEIKDRSPEQAYPMILARKIVIDYLAQQLEVLRTLDTDNMTIKFTDLSDVLKGTPEEVYVNLVARNTVLAHTEQQLDQMRVLAGLKEETVEATQERLKKDSTK